ncbi:hypothetical protein KYU75_003943 [Salmonella enterica]|nr:hypothetical protein [Salmonella enterica]
MITPETASQALSSWLAYLQITQETATQLITRAFLEQPARPEIAVHRIERDDGTVDYDAWRRNRINIFQRWRILSGSVTKPYMRYRRYVAVIASSTRDMTSE